MLSFELFGTEIFMTGCRWCPLSLKIALLFIYWPCCAACGILVPRPGIEPVHLAVEARSLNHWTTRKLPKLPFLDSSIFCLVFNPAVININPISFCLHSFVISCPFFYHHPYLVLDAPLVQNII